MRRLTLCALAVATLGLSPSAGAQPTQAQIEQAAKSTRDFYDGVTALANERENRLGGLTLGLGIVSRIGKYGGGAGAAYFGLNDKGRNAGYAGLVTFGFALFDEFSRVDEKIAERSACREIKNNKLTIFSTTTGWILNAADPEFQKKFKQVYDDFVKNLNDQIAGSKCNINYSGRLPALRAMLAKIV